VVSPSVMPQAREHTTHASITFHDLRLREYRSGRSGSNPGMGPCVFVRMSACVKQTRTVVRIIPPSCSTSPVPPSRSRGATPACWEPCVFTPSHVYGGSSVAWTPYMMAASLARARTPASLTPSVPVIAAPLTVHLIQTPKRGQTLTAGKYDDDEKRCRVHGVLFNWRTLEMEEIGGLIPTTRTGESVEETSRAIRPVGYLVIGAAFTHLVILVMLITTAVT
jgi:hypothetical protein